METYDEQVIAYLLETRHGIEPAFASEEARKGYYWVDLGGTETEISDQIHQSMVDYDG